MCYAARYVQHVVRQHKTVYHRYDCKHKTVTDALFSTQIIQNNVRKPYLHACRFFHVLCSVGGCLGQMSSGVSVVNSNWWNEVHQFGSDDKIEATMINDEQDDEACDDDGIHCLGFISTSLLHRFGCYTGVFMPLGLLPSHTFNHFRVDPLSVGWPLGV